MGSAGRSTRASRVALATFLFTVIPGVAHAGDTALAESLFQEGKKLMAKKNYGAACPKLAESQRLDPGGGTLLSLAICHEADGKTATAWSEFTEAAAIAKRDNRADRERIAEKHARLLEPKLIMLTITVAAKTPGFTLTRDGTTLGEAAWSTPSPVDPGEHELSASATGKKPWSTKLTTRADEKEPSITVPALEDVPPAPEPKASPETTPVKVAPIAPPQDVGSAKTVGLVIAGVGVAAVGAGVFFGVRASSQSSDANARCPQTQCGDLGAVDLQKDAQKSALVSTILLGAGAAAVIGGGIVFLASPSRPARREAARARLWVSPVSAGLAGAF